MRISNRFSVAVHVLLCVDAFSVQTKMTSETLAASVGVHPVVIRRILGLLKKAGLVDVAAGSGGTTLAREADGISLLDVYRAVESVDKTGLFRFHARPNLRCPVGRSIHTVLDGHMRDAQHALEASLQGVTLRGLARGVA